MNPRLIEVFHSSRDVLSLFLTNVHPMGELEINLPIFSSKRQLHRVDSGHACCMADLDAKMTSIRIDFDDGNCSD